jgi:Fic family protein
MQSPPYTQILEKIDKIFAEIKKLKPLSQLELREYRKSLLVHATYHSNAIEGNTLTLSETKLVIEDGLTIGGKTVREIRETTNHVRAFEILYDMVASRVFDEKSFKKIHAEILQGIDDENAGKYRKKQVWISGDEALPPPSAKVSSLMKELFLWLWKASKLHPVIRAAEWHYRCAKIHPFIDGNGRAMRLGINILLMSQGFPHVIIPVVRRQEYITSLHSSQTLDSFLDFFTDVVYQNMQDYKKMVK